MPSMGFPSTPDFSQAYSDNGSLTSANGKFPDSLKNSSNECMTSARALIAVTSFHWAV